MIVVDLGCETYADYPEDESVNKLIDRFRPSALLGFDPVAKPSDQMIGMTRVQIKNSAAWIYEGWIGLSRSNKKWEQLRTHVVPETESSEVTPCFDLAQFINKLPQTHEIILKMDVENSEYILLPHLIKHKVDERISLLLVEFHDLRPVETKEILDSLRCPLERW